MEPLFLILSESELELVPEEIQGHSAVRQSAKKRNKQPSEMLLDSSVHHKAMKTLEDFNRRGRPDIVHVTLLVAMDSILNREGLLQIYVHTRNDEVIWINPETKLPRNYSRFIGLMEQLFQEKTIKSNDSLLLSVEKKQLGQLLDELGTFNVLVWEKGKNVDPTRFFREHLDRKTAVIVGGFPHGDFKKSIEVADDGICLYSESLSAFTSAARMIFGFEEAVKNLKP